MHEEWTTPLIGLGNIIPLFLVLFIWCSTNLMLVRFMFSYMCRVGFLLSQFEVSLILILSELKSKYVFSILRQAKISTKLCYFKILNWSWNFKICLIYINKYVFTYKWVKTFYSIPKFKLPCSYLNYQLNLKIDNPEKKSCRFKIC